MRRRLHEKALLLLKVAQYARRASRTYRTHPLAMVARTVAVCQEHRFTAEEAFLLGFFDPRFRPEDALSYCSRKQFTKIQKRLNPSSLEALVRNKAIFYRTCLACGLPIPRLYAIVSRGTPCWTSDGRFLTEPEQWTTFLEQQIEPEFVIKPANATHGCGVMVLQRHDGRFTSALGNEYSTAAIYDHLTTDRDHDCFLLQQRLHNHGKLVHLTGIEHLQTVRLSTLIDTDGYCEVIYSQFKLIANSNVVDNFYSSSGGNLIAPVDLAEGRLGCAVTADPAIPGFTTVPRHPKTGLQIEGFQLPLWTEACDLVRHAAVRFAPVRTIGWDVALTPEGPVIVEGNIWWDPPILHKDIRQIWRTLERAAAATD